MNIGQAIKKRRQELGYSQEEFGKLFSPPASKSLISRWESNKILCVAPSRTSQLLKILNINYEKLDDLRNNAKLARTFNDSPTQNVTAKQIKQLRKDLGLTQEQFIEKIDGKPGQGRSGIVNNWEHGANLPNVTMKAINGLAKKQLENQIEDFLSVMQSQSQLDNIAQLIADKVAKLLRKKAKPTLKSQREFAEYLGVSSQTAFKYIHSDGLPYHKTSLKSYFFIPSEVDAWVEERMAKDNEKY